jgi:hypothetical protein
MAYALGMNAVIQYKSGGVGADPTTGWNTMGNVTDVTLNAETAEADVTTRSNNGWRATVPTLKDGGIEFEMIWDPSDAGFTAIQQAFLNSTIIGIRALDKAPDGSAQGLRADMAVTNFSRTEPLEEAIKASVSLKPTYTTEANGQATWVTNV